MIGAAQLRMMKPTAYLINTCRGPVVDEPALIEALQAGTIAGAGLDVFDQEPAAAEQSAVCPAERHPDGAFRRPDMGKPVHSVPQRVRQLPACDPWRKTAMDHSGIGRLTSPQRGTHLCCHRQSTFGRRQKTCTPCWPPLARRIGNAPRCFKSWTINDIVQHLHEGDLMAAASVAGADPFASMRAEMQTLRDSGIEPDRGHAASVRRADGSFPTRTLARHDAGPVR